MSDTRDTGEDFVVAATEPLPPPEGIGTAEGEPAPPAVHVPAEGWLVEPQLMLCWANAVAGKIVEVRLAVEYEATVFDSGVGDAVTSLVNTGIPVAK